MKNQLLFILPAALIIGLTACEKDDDTVPMAPVNEEEVITTMRLSLVNQTTNDTSVFSFQDLDGDGGNAPIIIGDTLDANAAYTGSVVLLNEVEGEDITMEVEDEAEEHQFFYASTIADITWSYTDQDADGNPVGITTAWNSGAAGSGMLTVTLRHEPNKAGAGVSSGDITNADGETDIEVMVPVVVQ